MGKEGLSVVVMSISRQNNIMNYMQTCNLQKQKRIAGRFCLIAGERKSPLETGRGLILFRSSDRDSGTMHCCEQ